MDPKLPIIFLNYRWLDSSDATGRIFDNLSSNLSKDLIFFDHENIDYGDSIPQHISDGLQHAKILLVIIGNPGVGKSTFARWLCHHWAQKPEKYDALPFYIALREVSDMGVAGFWAHIAGLLKLTDIPTAMKIVDKMAHRIQWILDGYDELSQHKQLQLFKTMQGLLEGRTWAKNSICLPYRMG